MSAQHPISRHIASCDNAHRLWKTSSRDREIQAGRECTPRRGKHRQSAHELSLGVQSQIQEEPPPASRLCEGRLRSRSGAAPGKASPSRAGPAFGNRGRSCLASRASIAGEPRRAQTSALCDACASGRPCVPSGLTPATPGSSIDPAPCEDARSRWRRPHHQTAIRGRGVLIHEGPLPGAPGAKGMMGEGPARGCALRHKRRCALLAISASGRKSATAGGPMKRGRRRVSGLSARRRLHLAMSFETPGCRRAPQDEGSLVSTRRNGAGRRPRWNDVN